MINVVPSDPPPEASIVASNGVHTFRYMFSGYHEISHNFFGQSATITYLHGDALSSTSEIFACNALTVDVTPVSSELIVPGSLDFELAGRRYEDASGAVYTDVDPATGSGAFAGTLNNQSGKVELTAWEAGGANTAYLHALATRVGQNIVEQAVITSPGRPTQVGSAQITATDVYGNSLVATADADGKFNAAGISGSYNYSLGQGFVRFGDWILPTGHEGDPDYNPGAVINGLWFRPRQVIADSIRLNVVIVTSIPVDDAIVGFPTAQLPAHGRVPWVRDGDVLAIIDTQSTVAATASAGGTVDLGRDRLERVWVRDAAGVKLPVDRYSADLDAGIFAWSAPLALAGYSAPYTIYHRRMFKSPVVNVSIDGTIKLALPVNYASLAAGCLVSTALLVGDMQGRVTNLFHQNTWGDGWHNSSQNGTPSALYNADDFPVLVSNQSSTDSYAFVFLSDPAKYKIVSKHRGTLVTNIPISSDYTLTNKVTGEDELTIYAAGFGVGWLPGNTIRVDVRGAKQEFDLALSIQQGAQAGDVQRLAVEMHGGI